MCSASLWLGSGSPSSSGEAQGAVGRLSPSCSRNPWTFTMAMGPSTKRLISFASSPAHRQSSARSRTCRALTSMYTQNDGRSRLPPPNHRRAALKFARPNGLIRRVLSPSACSCMRLNSTLFFDCIGSNIITTTIHFFFFFYYLQLRPYHLKQRNQKHNNNVSKYSSYLLFQSLIFIFCVGHANVIVYLASFRHFLHILILIFI
jgi:hypothetical protein